jgi:hypothetical protein
MTSDSFCEKLFLQGNSRLNKLSQPDYLVQNSSENPFPRMKNFRSEMIPSFLAGDDPEFSSQNSLQERDSLQTSERARANLHAEES